MDTAPARQTKGELLGHKTGPLSSTFSRNRGRTPCPSASPGSAAAPACSGGLGQPSLLPGRPPVMAQLLPRPQGRVCLLLLLLVKGMLPQPSKALEDEQDIKGDYSYSNLDLDLEEDGDDPSDPNLEPDPPYEDGDGLSDPDLEPEPPYEDGDGLSDLDLEPEPPYEDGDGLSDPDLDSEPPYEDDDGLSDTDLDPKPPSEPKPWDKDTSQEYPQGPSQSQRFREFRTCWYPLCLVIGVRQPLHTLRKLILVQELPVSQLRARRTPQ
ncbi:uncharacterized protein LOC119936516 isoform X2 [Tachyglossus aculeatus]|uniref:uncharacterized protein LOC119936516 isoform X2 n=1 Tax=Tachyglossus aculeatus TaxID=9261 RepID=UPI0018F4B3C5|nr:uncharacterized protein LOC119936516 isoform X2 [Tachyglossus aculeatus]